MKKCILNYAIDMGILLAFMVTFITGIVKWPGIILKFGFNYRDFPMSYFTIMHDWGGLVMSLLSFAHVMMHRKWIWTMTKKLLRGKKNEKKFITGSAGPDKCIGNAECVENE
ncbi:MAG: DUF4405 domain-containing protein [Spirochaetes bacterium]|nr:DUF4405 domain-containing protein [Spirochaetota bacterium]